MKSPLIVKLEGAIYFLIPFLTVMSSSLLTENMTYAKAAAYLCGALVSGLTGLKAFLSTTFSDSLPDAPAAAPETKPAATAAQPNP